MQDQSPPDCSSAARRLAEEAIAHGAMQKASELGALVDLISARTLRTVLEIGTARGGTLYVWCQIASPDALLVSVDLPGGPFGGGYSDEDAEVFRTFAKEDQQLVLLREDSHDEATRRRVEDILGGRKIDLLFIDGDHTYRGVREDFFHYANLVADDGVVVLHDIAVHSEVPECRVDLLWEELSGDFEHVVLRDPVDDRGWGEWGGIGVLYGAHMADRADFPIRAEAEEAIGQDITRAVEAAQALEERTAEQAADLERYRVALARRDTELQKLKAHAHELARFQESVLNSLTWRTLLSVHRLRQRSSVVDRGLRIVERAAHGLLDRRTSAPKPVPPSSEAILEPRSGLSFGSISFEPVGSPKVSIVIPIYRNADLTLRCLDSVARHTQGELFEVIVVDDASGDETPAQISSVPGIRLLQNPENEGFLESCNRGAAAASGDYLVLLNNDTRVTPGWLQALLEAAESDPHIGAVGSKLVYPDGSLQEAGSIVWRDGSAWNFGRGRDPDEPEFNFRRDVDYCSAASLLVRRAFWDELGGFDSRYRPGYYEDTDLCFGLADMGFRVVYEPQSVVIHYEGSTHGTDNDHAEAVAAGGKKSQYRNQALFAEKWANRLENHLPPGTAGGYRGGRRDPRPRILVIDTWVPAHDRDAGSLRMYWMLRIFSGMTGWTSLLPWDGELREPYVSELQKYGIEVLPYAPKLRGLEHRGTDFYDIVLISRPHVAEEFLAAVRKRFPGATVIYDTVDLHHLRYSRKRDTVGLGALDEERGVDVDEIRRAEVKCFHASDIVAVVTEAEASIIQELAPTSHAVVLPTVHPIPTEPLPGYDGRTGILFIGSYQHDPNVDAVMYFARQIFPEIAARIDAQFFVLGADPPAEVLALQSPRIVVTGYLPSVDEYFLRAKVFVAPMRYGAGMKGKIGHALAFGVPVVTSSVGAEGMDLADADAALIRDEPNEFGAAVLGLYEDAELWRRLSRRGQEVVRERWTPDVMARRLEALLTDLAGLKAA